jgi:hypothetical protein
MFASLASLAAFILVQFAITVGVEFLEHPRAHLGPLGAAFSRRRGGLVALLCRGGARQHGGQQHRINRNKASHRYSSPGKEWTASVFLRRPAVARSPEAFNSTAAQRFREDEIYSPAILAGPRPARLFGAPQSDCF